MTILFNKELTHDMFIPSIYEWVMHSDLDKWIRTETKTMDNQKFIDCLIYLIACGVPLEFNNDMTKFRKINSFQETLSEWDSVKEQSSRVASIQERGETLYSKRIKDLSKGINSLKSPEINPNNKFQNKLI